MTYRLTCQTPSTLQRWLVRSGESARVGSSRWMDFHVGEDGGLAPEHLKIEYTDRLKICSIGDATFTVHGELLSNGVFERDVSLEAGQTVLRFEHLLASDSAPASESSAQPLPETPKAIWPHRQELIEQIRLSENAVSEISSCESPLQALMTLEEKQLEEDALRLLVGLLPPPEVIACCFDVLESHDLMESQELGLEVRAWLEQPTEERRANIESKVVWTKQSSPVTWLLAAIAWSRETLKAEETSQLSATRKMIISAMITSLQLAATLRNHRELRRYCLDRGMKSLGLSEDRRS